MAQTVCVIVEAEDRERLAAVIGDRNRPQKHVKRAWIVVLSADRLPVLEVAHRTAMSRPAVWRWQRRFAEQGVDGLLRDKTRPPGKAPVPAATVAKVLALTCAEPPGETTHWTGRAMAQETGVSLRTIQHVLGHKSMRTTELYMHVTQPGAERLQETLDRLMVDL